MLDAGKLESWEAAEGIRRKVKGTKACGGGYWGWKFDDSGWRHQFNFSTS
jgi:hypothetical protein